MNPKSCKAIEMSKYLLMLIKVLSFRGLAAIKEPIFSINVVNVHVWPNTATPHCICYSIHHDLYTAG